MICTTQARQRWSGREEGVLFLTKRQRRDRGGEQQRVEHE
jgi:hypothetical protein